MRSYRRKTSRDPACIFRNKFMYRTSLQRNLPCSRADMRVICDLFVVHSDEMHWLGIVSRRESPEVCSQEAVAGVSVLQGHCKPSVTDNGFANSANPQTWGRSLSRETDDQFNRRERRGHACENDRRRRDCQWRRIESCALPLLLCLSHRLSQNSRASGRIHGKGSPCS